MSDKAEAFTECWRADAPRVLAYARRHTSSEDAADVVAETFMVAWRRWDEVPRPPIGWLLRTASGVIRNRSRGHVRRHRLAGRVALLNQAAAVVSDAADDVVRRDEALRRLASLTHEQRETLLLVTWDGLTPDEAARVLGIRPATFRKRLSRARQLLHQNERPPNSSPSPVPATLIGQELS